MAKQYGGGGKLTLCCLPVAIPIFATQGTIQFPISPPLTDLSGIQTGKRVFDPMIGRKDNSGGKMLVSPGLFFGLPDGLDVNSHHPQPYGRKPWLTGESQRQQIRPFFPSSKLFPYLNIGKLLRV